MEREMELHQAVYLFLLTQIQFGFYRYADSLPTMEETCKQFHVSIDTVRPAYHRLRQEGYISLSKKAGAKVAVQYAQPQIEQHIQSYFTIRKHALLDLSKSIWPLFGWAQWLGLKHASTDTMDGMVQLSQEEIQASYGIWRHLEQKYNALGNNLLIRLTRYIYLFYHGPFFCVMTSDLFLKNTSQQVQKAIACCRQKDWKALPDVLFAIHNIVNSALSQFCKEKVVMPPRGEAISFYWDAYQKSSQLRYSLAMELLIDISRGQYPAGSYLPSATRLSQEKNVSVSTVRRAVSLLNSIGAVKSSRPLGARVLPPAQSTENCDFTRPDIRKRLLDLTESLQIFALSCRSVSALTLTSLEAASLQRWKQRLLEIQSMGRYELITYASLELIAEFAPYQAIRTIYTELLRLLFWGNPLRGMRGDPKVTNSFFAPYFSSMIACLKEPDIAHFSTQLEELLLYELRVTIDLLLQLGIPEVETILVPGKNECWNPEYDV